MVISDTSCMIDVFTIALLMTEFGQVWASLGKSGQSMCVMTSRHSCCENRKVNEAFRGIAVIKM